MGQQIVLWSIRVLFDTDYFLTLWEVIFRDSQAYHTLQLSRRVLESHVASDMISDLLECPDQHERDVQVQSQKH